MSDPASHNTHKASALEICVGLSGACITATGIGVILMGTMAGLTDRASMIIGPIVIMIGLVMLFFTLPANRSGKDDRSPPFTM